MSYHPTVRCEQDKNQPEEIDKEKRRINEKCIPDIRKKCKMKNSEIIALFYLHLKRNSIIDEIVFEVVRDSCKIHHIVCMTQILLKF